MAKATARPNNSAATDLAFIRSMVIPIPLLCFVGAVATDWTYTAAEDLMWVDFSSWLIAAGLLSGAIAAIVLLVSVIAGPNSRRRAGWPALAVLVAGLVIEFINVLIHARDGWTAVVPTGMVLSIIGALVVGIAAWLSRAQRAQVRA